MGNTRHWAGGGKPQTANIEHRAPSRWHLGYHPSSQPLGWHAEQLTGDWPVLIITPSLPPPNRPPKTIGYSGAGIAGLIRNATSQAFQRGVDPSKFTSVDC